MNHTDQRRSLLRHLKTMHKNEMDFKIKNSKILDCETRMCKTFYGVNQIKLWCTECTNRPKPKKLKRKVPGFCSECGKNVKNLTYHIKVMHSEEQTKICPHCSIELKSDLKLKSHIKWMHEKIPCIHCGKLISVAGMHRHIISLHTTDERKFKCDICPKGFITNQRLNEHKNIHTGEKPFKCKFCSKCFASRGTQAMHQRSHLGHHRNHAKK